jgi:hypothetical protein
VVVGVVDGGGAVVVGVVAPVPPDALGDGPGMVVGVAAGAGATLVARTWSGEKVGAVAVSVVWNTQASTLPATGRSVAAPRALYVHEC